MKTRAQHRPANDPLLRFLRRSNASLSNKQWENVQDSLKFGVNADAKLPKKYSLREALPNIAFCCWLAGRRPKTTSKRMAAELTRIIGSCNALLTCLDPKNFPNYPTIDNDSKRLWDLTSPIKDGLEAYIAELERWRNELPKTNTRDYVSTAHNLFWQELVRIFDAHVHNDVKFRNRHKKRFLRACTEPFFPEVITDDDGAISAFVERRSTRSTSST